MEEVKRKVADKDGPLIKSLLHFGGQAMSLLKRAMDGVASPSAGAGQQDELR